MCSIYPLWEKCPNIPAQINSFWVPYSMDSSGITMNILTLHPIVVQSDAVSVCTLGIVLGTIHKWRHPRGGGRGVQKTGIWGDFQGITGVTRGGRGVKKLEKWGDVIYGWPQRKAKFKWVALCLLLYRVTNLKWDKEKWTLLINEGCELLMFWKRNCEFIDEIQGA